MGDTMSKHTATPTAVTAWKERLAKLQRSSTYGKHKTIHACFGKRCATHMPLWDWMAAR